MAPSLAAPAISATSEGWWNATALPDNPLRGTVPAVKVPSPDIPEGLIPVSTRVGQPARVGAIGITFDAPRGTTTVRSLVMHLKESDAGGVQQGTGAAVRACPITSFLVPETNGDAANLPAEDCDVAHADGKRNDDGTWTFDLTSMAAAWVDPFGTITPNGVRLDPVGDAPATFQVVFTGMEDATFDADLGRATAPADPFASGPAAGAFGSGGAGGFSTPTIAVPSVTAPAARPAPTKPGRSITAAPAALSRRAGDTFGNLSLGLLLVLVAGLLLAGFTSWTLGPGGQDRDAAIRRQGGVSRALALRQPPSNP
jgi:hypothetical protein